MEEKDKRFEDNEVENFEREAGLEEGDNSESLDNMNKLDNEENKSNVENSVEKELNNENAGDLAKDVGNGNKVDKKQESQIKWVVFLMIGMLVIVLVVPFFVENFINTFDYNGLEVRKTKVGDLIIYNIGFPVVSGTGQVIGDYSVKLRNDPRELDDVEIINVSDGKIEFARHTGGFSDVYLSLDTGMKKCEENIVALTALTAFLGDSGLPVKSAVYNRSYAEENNITFKNCWDSDLDTIIKVRSADRNYIKEAKRNCYEIGFKDCDILKSTERFELLILEEYAERFMES